MAIAGAPTRSAPGQGRLLWSYGIAHYGKSLLWQTSELLFTFFLIETCDLSLMQAASILVATMVVNAAIDAELGKQLSRRGVSLTGAARLQLAGGSVATIAFAIVGATAMLDQPLRLPIAATAILCLRVSYPFLDVPQNTMLVLLTASERQRARLAAARVGLSGAAAITSACTFLFVFRGAGISIQSSGFLVVAALFASIAFTGSLCLWGVLQHSGQFPTLSIKERGNSHEPTHMQFAALGRKLIFIAIFISSLAWSSFVRLQPFSANYTIRSVADGYVFVIGIAAFNVLSQLLWPRLTARHSVEHAFLAAAASLAIGSILLGFAITTTTNLLPIAVALYGIGSGGLSTAIWALAARQGHHRGDGGYRTMGLLTACSKLGIASGTATAVAMIWIFDLNKSGDEHTIFYYPTLIPAIAALCIAAIAQYLKAGQSRQHLTEKN